MRGPTAADIGPMGFCALGHVLLAFERKVSTWKPKPVCIISLHPDRGQNYLLFGVRSLGYPLGLRHSSGDGSTMIVHGSV